MRQTSDCSFEVFAFCGKIQEFFLKFLLVLKWRFSIADKLFILVSEAFKIWLQPWKVQINEHTDKIKLCSQLCSLTWIFRRFERWKAATLLLTIGFVNLWTAV